MRTNFAEARLADPGIQEANGILRACVHCGFCLATCPTYLLLGDELDSPRGRIYLAKEMLENDRSPSASVVKHIDRCLTCLSCMTTCPSGVHYAHLIDRARIHIEQTYERPRADRLLRRFIATVVSRPALFRLMTLAGRLGRPFARLMPGRLRDMVASTPRRFGAPSWADRPQVIAAEGSRRMRVALLSGCVQQALRPEINEATVRLLARHGCEVVITPGMGCCGGIFHQMGWEERTKRAAKANIAAWERVIADDGLDAIVFNASGCGVMLKEYGHLLRDDPHWASRAERIASLCRNISEVVIELGLRPPVIETGQQVTYHMACTMQHGLGLRAPAKTLLAHAGFAVTEPAESHICCGSAGVYSILQPELSERLVRRKVTKIEATKPEIVAAGNIGCIIHIANRTRLPVVHVVELLDWATGGDKPIELAQSFTLDAANPRTGGISI
jgi:glycolate dehydrogenase iron-sulfur subunit